MDEIPMTGVYFFSVMLLWMKGSVQPTVPSECKRGRLDECYLYRCEEKERLKRVTTSTHGADRAGLFMMHCA